MQTRSVGSSSLTIHWDSPDPKDTVNLYRGIQLQLITALLSLGLAVAAAGIPGIMTDATKPNADFSWIYTSFYIVITILVAIDIWISCVQAVIYFRWEVTVKHTSLFFLLGFIFDVVCAFALGKDLALWTGTMAVLTLVGALIYWYDIAENVYPTVGDKEGLIKNQRMQRVKLFCFSISFTVLTLLQVLMNVHWLDLLVGIIGLIFVIADLLNFSVFKSLLEN